MEITVKTIFLKANYGNYNVDLLTIYNNTKGQKNY